LDECVLNKSLLPTNYLDECVLNKSLLPTNYLDECVLNKSLLPTNSRPQVASLLFRIQKTLAVGQGRIFREVPGKSEYPGRYGRGRGSG